MALKDIVNVVITRETTPVSQAGFGIVLFAAEFLTSETTTPFTERVRYYTSAQSVLDDGFEASSKVYKAVASAFAQSPAPTRVGVGRKSIEVGSEDADWPTALAAINAESSDWYGLAIDSRVKADQLAVAAWAEANKKLFGCASNESGILVAATEDDIASQLQDGNYARTFLMYHAKAGEADDQWPEMAWPGRMYPIDLDAPGVGGQPTWMFKTLAGVTVDTLTDTQSQAALAKNCNLYQSIGGVSITREGKVAGGEYIDIIRGIDWLEARMTEDVYALLVNRPKVPYTDAGAQAIGSIVRQRLDIAIAVSFLAADPAYELNIPEVASIPFNDRANRKLPGINWRATVAGAIHAVTINGAVTV